MQKQLKYYQTLNGKSPFIKWLESLKDNVTRARIQARLNRLISNNFGDCEPVGEGVFELRIHFGAGYRVYFAEIDHELILLLFGGNKHQQSVDIKKAQEYWYDFKGRTNA